MSGPWRSVDESDERLVPVSKRISPGAPASRAISNVLGVGLEDERASNYRDRTQRFDAEAREWNRRSDRLAHSRTAAALVAIACFVAGAKDFLFPAWLWLVAMGLAAIAFVRLVNRHRWVRQQRNRAAAMAGFNRQGVARIERNWDRLPEVSVPPGVELTATARDLDLFGPASVYRLCCLATTGAGRSWLARWLLAPVADENEAVTRQRAVAELASELDRRQELCWRGHSAHRSTWPADGTALIRWAEGPSWLAPRPRLIWYARVSPVLFVVMAALDYFDLAPGFWWQLILSIQVLVSFILVRRVHAIFRDIDSGEQQLHRFARMLEHLEAWPVSASALVTLQQRFTVDGYRAHAQLAALRRRLDLADLRFAQLPYTIIQATTLWDFHVLGAMECWKARVGPHVRVWLDALAEFEATCSLASLTYENPAWTFPQLDSAERRVAATDLGHPLIPTARRVGNDVELGPPGTFLLLTGSNMSGKSTLLRAIGVNLVLAQAGAPVCAKAMSLPRVILETSMRIDDSLANGVSLYLAELQRLKAIVEKARHCDTPGQPVLVFLLDEILHGTNSRDRQIAVRRVIGHLLACHAIGAVSTHDLELAASPSLTASSRAAHFRETLEGEGADRRMTFDYVLRPGISGTTNAIELLDMVGLKELPG